MSKVTEIFKDKMQWVAAAIRLAKHPETYKNAIYAYKKTLELGMLNNPVVHNNLGAVLYKSSNEKEAEYHWRLAAALGSEDAKKNIERFIEKKEEK